jgi:FtsH-binding integral membrane protein
VSSFDPTRRIPLDYAPGREISLTRFFNQVYAWMCVGLAVTGVTAYLMQGFFIRSPFLIVAAALGAFALSIVAQQVAMRISAAVGLVLFLLYAASIGVLISSIFLRYRLETIGAAFFVTGGVFAGMSIIGFVTKKNLSGIGGIAVMCCLGLFLASLVNIFLQSSALMWFITYAVVAVFIVLTAYDTQKLKGVAEQFANNPTMLQRAAVVGSLVLYIDFINLFLAILRIMGNRK